MKKVERSLKINLKFLQKKIIVWKNDVIFQFSLKFIEICKSVMRSFTTFQFLQYAKLFQSIERVTKYFFEHALKI